jgi:hypothetical protein
MHFSHMTRKEKYREEELQPQRQEKINIKEALQPHDKKRKKIEKRHFSRMTRKEKHRKMAKRLRELNE